jgi:hypothetical protein
VYVIGVVPAHVPVDDVSVEPSSAVPEMVGGVWFVGTEVPAALPEPAPPKAAPIASALTAISAAVPPRRAMCLRFIVGPPLVECTEGPSHPRGVHA